MKKDPETAKVKRSPRPQVSAKNAESVPKDPSDITFRDATSTATLKPKSLNDSPQETTPLGADDTYRDRSPNVSDNSTSKVLEGSAAPPGSRSGSRLINPNKVLIKKTEIKDDQIENMGIISPQNKNSVPSIHSSSPSGESFSPLRPLSGSLSPVQGANQTPPIENVMISSPDAINRKRLLDKAKLRKGLKPGARQEENEAAFALADNTIDDLKNN